MAISYALTVFPQCRNSKANLNLKIEFFEGKNERRLSGRGNLHLGEECCGFSCSQESSDQDGCLLFQGPTGFPSLPVRSLKMTKNHRKIF